MSGNRRGARLKCGRCGCHASEIALDGERRELNTPWQRQRWRRRKQRGAGHRHDGADGANIARMLTRVVIGCRLPRTLTVRYLNGETIGEGKPGRGGAKVGAGCRSGNAVEMAERQRKLDAQRKKRHPSHALEVRPEPVHAKTHLSAKGPGYGPSRRRCELRELD